MSARKPSKIAIVLKGYPRLSETFIAQELLGLERVGFNLQLVSLRHPTDKTTHPVHEEISAPVNYLPEYLHDEPVRLWRSWRKVRRWPGYKLARQQWLADMRATPTRNQMRRFGQAVVLAAELGDDVGHLHAHFIHTPASVTHYASLLTGLAWSCSAHAKDIWTSSDSDLKGKLSSARWVVTCTRNGWRHLQSLSPQPEHVHLSYHGLDLSRFDVPPARQMLADGQAGQPVELITVCRAVEKKGLDVLMQALAELPPDLNWRWSHIGAGELVVKLKAQAQELGLEERLNWLGAQPQTQVLERYRRSDIFVLPCRIAVDGDRDGLPNVIVEAQSQCLPVISSDISGVPELIEHGVNGLLCQQNDVACLTNCLLQLIAAPETRQKMGAAGAAKVRSAFDHTHSITDLRRLFGDVGIKVTP